MTAILFPLTEITMKKAKPFLLVLALMSTLCTPFFVHAKDSSAVVVGASPGKGAAVRTRTVVATVEEIDTQQRRVTLKGPKGNLIPLVLGPDARNLEQVKVGDSVAVRYTEALSLTLKKDGKELRGSSETVDGARSAAGERPAGVVAEEIEVTADVIAIDPKSQLVTLRGPKQTVDLWVRDPKQFKLIKVGDQVQAVYTQALALSVQPAKTAKK